MGDQNILPNIFAVQGELQEIMRNLLKMLSLEHKHAANHKGDPNVGLANILTTAFNNGSPTDVLRSLKANYDSIYDKTFSPPVVRSSIDIDSLDSAFMFDILESINGFQTCNIKLKQKKSLKCNKAAHIDKCCIGCNHSCKSCLLLNCKKTCPGYGQDHPCLNCEEDKTSCKRNSIICCTKCKLCRRCGKQEEESVQCSVLRLCIGVDVAHLLRNLFGHLTKQVCKDFLEGKRQFKGFKSKNWNDFVKEIEDASNKIVGFLMDQLNFQFQPPLTVDQGEKFARKVKTILENNSSFVNDHFSGSIDKAINDLKNETFLKELIEDNFSQLKRVVQEGHHEINESMNIGFKQIISRLDNIQPVPRENSLAIQKASQSLKDWYLQKFSQVNRGAAFARSNSTSTFVSHDEIFVDVTLLNSQNNEMKTFGLRSLITESNKCTILNGVPGVGKTTLMKSLVYKWASGELLNGENGNPCYDFVFLLFCRNFNRYRGKSNGIEEYIANEYPQSFDNLNFKDLRRNECKVLLVIEGFDESSCYEEFQQMTDDLKNVSDHCRAIFDLVNPENPSLPFHRLITTRPLSRSLLKRFNKVVQIKSVEILGFSRNQIREYVEKHFSNDPEKSKTVCGKLSENPQLMQLGQRPVFCWAFCSLFKDDPLYDIPISITSIYASIILIFLRNHCTRRTSEDLKDILTIPQVKKILLELAEIAYMSLVNGNIAFKIEDVKIQNADFIQVTKESGLIEIIEGGDLHDKHFQFTHLSVHEFLAAFYIYLKNLYAGEAHLKTSEVIFSLPSSFLFLAGFIGGQLEDSQSHIFTKMFSNVKGNKFSKVANCTELIKSLKNEKRTNLYYEMLFEFQNPIGMLPETTALVLPPTLNPLTSYRTICVNYLFEYIKERNNNRVPFLVIQLDTINVDKDVTSTIIPYLSQLDGFVVVQCIPGFIKSISCHLPNIRFVTLPHCGVSPEDWRSFAHRTSKAFSNGTIRFNEFRVVDNFTSYYNHSSIVPKCVCNLLPFFQHAEMQLDISRIKILTCERQFQSRLRSLKLILNSFDQFNEIAKRVYKLPNLKVVEIELFVECNHQIDNRVKRSTNEQGGESLIFKTCDICQEEMFKHCRLMCSEHTNGTFRFSRRFIGNRFPLNLEMIISNQNIESYGVVFSRD